MDRYVAKAKLPGSAPDADVSIEAKGSAEAKKLLEAQYGKGNVKNVRKG
ncbi:hypothetical protein [Spiribacter roseus]